MSKKLPRIVDVEALKFMEMPKEFWQSKIANIENVADGRHSIKNYIGKLDVALKRGHGVFIAGPRFSGKSYIASLLCKVFYARWITPQWGFLPNMMDNIIKDRLWDTEEYESYNNRYNNCDVLVMDGLGHESPNLANKATNIVQHRLDEKKITIITSSLKADQINDRYGDDWIDVLKYRFVFLPLKEVVVKSVDENYRD